MTAIPIAAGLDIHKMFIVGTILDRDGKKIDQQRFSRDRSGLESLRAWVLKYHCEIVGCESTNNFWYHIHDYISPSVSVIVGNAYDMKVSSHKKTDRIDSEIIATLAQKGMISPSRIFPPHLRDFRNLVRIRHFLVRKSTDIKNRIHSVYSAEFFHISRILSDVFGTTGSLIISGILRGDSPEEILLCLPPYVREKKGEQLQPLLQHAFSPAALEQLKYLIQELHVLSQEIAELTEKCVGMAVQLYPNEYPILRSVPGVGDVAATTLLAEIGAFRDFSTGDKLASWVGIVPRVYQSADHNAKCAITKRGSYLVRMILTQIAHAAVRKKDTRFAEYFQMKKDKMGAGKAIIAVARKILTIIWHLVVNNEIYEEEGGKKKNVKPRKFVKIPLDYSLVEALKIFAEAAGILGVNGLNLSGRENWKPGDRVE